MISINMLDTPVANYLNTHIVVLSTKKHSLELLLLKAGWNRVHDLLSFFLIINFEGKKILWSSKLELGGVGLLVVFNDDFLGFWKMLLLSSHNLDEFLKILDFLWHYVVSVINI